MYYFSYNVCKKTFLQSKIPVFTMPKNLCTLMMLAATDTKGRLHRMIPADMSYPEKQSYELYKKGEIVPTEVRISIFR